MLRRKVTRIELKPEDKEEVNDYSIVLMIKTFKQGDILPIS